MLGTLVQCTGNGLLKFACSAVHMFMTVGTSTAALISLRIPGALATLKDVGAWRCSWTGGVTGVGIIFLA
jgi:hypothetical protein